MKKFIITIDTEGDNLWEWKNGKEITTENCLYLMRFQALCDKYSFKPVWLSDWEMINDKRYVDFISSNLEKCEVGMHLHAWNNPPYYELPIAKKSGAPYLIEYPTEIIEAKIDCITKEFERKFGLRPISHRAGRWAINEDIFKLLFKYGYKIDCSITPGIDWGTSVGQTPGSKGIDYTNERLEVTYKYNLLEVPLTTSNTFFYSLRTFKEMKGASRYKYLANSIVRKKRIITLRPNGFNLDEMIWLAEYVKKNGPDYLMFMLHSSELMPGGSPTFRNEESVEKLYDDMDKLFCKVSRTYYGCTLAEYLSIVEKKC